MYHPHPDFAGQKPVTHAQLDEVLHAKMLHTEGIPGPLIIHSIEMVKRDPFVFVITTTEDGLQGISMVHKNWQYFYPILEKKIVPYLIGKDARELEDLLEFVYVQELNYKIQGLAYWCCISWVEASILDLLGKAAGKPMGELFGPRCNEEVEYYVASGNRGTTPEEEIAILERRIAETGVKALKFKVGGRMSNNQDSIEGRSEGLIFLARRHFGDQMTIHADGNGSYDAPTAITYGKMLEEIGAYFYEEPCRFDDIWETKKVADALDIPLAFGEQETSLRRFQWIIENDAAQVIQADVHYNGGFIRTAKVAKMAALAGKPITPHISGGIGYANVLWLASFTPNMGHYQELKVGYNETKDFFTTDLVLKDGKLNIPKGVGLGMEYEPHFFDHAVTIFRGTESRRSKNLDLQAESTQRV